MSNAWSNRRGRIPRPQVCQPPPPPPPPLPPPPGDVFIFLDVFWSDDPLFPMFSHFDGALIYTGGKTWFDTAIDNNGWNTTVTLTFAPGDETATLVYTVNDGITLYTFNAIGDPDVDNPPIILTFAPWAGPGFPTGTATGEYNP